MIRGRYILRYPTIHRGWGMGLSYAERDGSAVLLTETGRGKINGVRIDVPGLRVWLLFRRFA